MLVEPIISDSFDSNLYLINKTVLIDAGLNGNLTVNRISKYVNISKINLIILTHSHVDHFGGIFSLLKISNPKIGISHEELLSLNDPILSVSNLFNISKHEQIITPDFLYNDNDSIFVGINPYNKKNEYLTVIETPGHTNGSICLYSKKHKLLFSGDTVFDHGIGRTDFKNSSPIKLINSIKKLLNLNIETIYPGHGFIISKDTKKSLLYSYELSLNLI